MTPPFPFRDAWMSCHPRLCQRSTPTLMSTLCATCYISEQTEELLPSPIPCTEGVPKPSASSPGCSHSSLSHPTTQKWFWSISSEETICQTLSWLVKHCLNGKFLFHTFNHLWSNNGPRLSTPAPKRDTWKMLLDPSFHPPGSGHWGSMENEPLMGDVSTLPSLFLYLYCQVKKANL